MIEPRRIVVWLVIVILGVTALVLYQRQLHRYDGDWISPVRVHLLRSRELPAADCRLNEQEAQNILRRVNRIWEPARIQFELDSLVEEEAVNLHQVSLEEGRINLGAVQELRPLSSWAQHMIHVYYVHRMTSNGVFQGLDAIFVQDAAELHPVPGGIDTPLPRVTAHEIGHALGLPHREAVTNLMASGTTGISLSNDEIQTARRTASGLSFARKRTP
jgi:hypothetical protein